MISKSGQIQILVALYGDVQKQPGHRVKYGHFINQLNKHVSIIQISDASLTGFPKWINAISTFHFNPIQWRQRFYKNVWAFRMRSQQFCSQLNCFRGQIDLVLQLGVMFDSTWYSKSIPTVIYTDYTASLSSQKPSLGRSPLNKRKLQQWLQLEKQTYERAIHICTRSKHTRESIIRDYQISPQKISVIGGGVNFDQLPDENCIKQDNPLSILFVGADFYRKGADVLLSAYTIVRRRIPEVSLVMVTKSPDPSIGKLEGVTVIEPTWDRQLIHDLYLRASVFVLPSRLETWGDVLLEAMAYGIPCIGTSSDAIGEIILDGLTGKIIPPNDQYALSEALTSLLGDKRLRSKMGLAGRRRVEEKFMWKHVINRLLPIIESVKG